MTFLCTSDVGQLWWWRGGNSRREKDFEMEKGEGLKGSVMGQKSGFFFHYCEVIL